VALRAEALSMQGRYGPAIESFDSALAANPRSPELLNGRAIARAALGRLAEASVDWRHQLEQLPAGQTAARAYVAMRLADWKAALPELELMTARFPGDLYWRLYRLTASRRLGLAPGKIETSSMDLRWPAPLIALHAGAATPDDVTRRADTQERKAEADFQLGVLSLPGDKAAAVESWNEVARSADKTLVEYAAASNELSRLHS